MTQTTSIKLNLGLFILLFLWVEVAEARLFRTSGRGEQADVYSDSIYFINNSNLNDVGIKPSYNIWGDSYFDTSFIEGQVHQTGGLVGVKAAPSECINGYSRLDVEEAEQERQRLEYDLSYYDEGTQEYQAIVSQIDALYEPFSNDPCLWEFEQGEDLFTWGAFYLLFDNPDVDYFVNWQISGQGKVWNLSGSLNTQSGLTDPNDPDYTIALNSLMLNTTPPVDLLPGDYSINVSVGISSDDGRFFSVSDKPGDEVTISEFCKESPEFSAWMATLDSLSGDALDEWIANNPEPDFEICGYNSGRFSYDEVYDDLYDPYKELVGSQSSMTFYSQTESLRILASSFDEPLAVNANAPASIGLFIVGLTGLFARNLRRHHH